MQGHLTEIYMDALEINGSLQLDTWTHRKLTEGPADAQKFDGSLRMSHGRTEC